MKQLKTYFLILTAFLFISCGDNTLIPITHDISSIKINETETNKTMYSTDDTLSLTATVYFDDGTEANATNNVIWDSSNAAALGISAGKIFPYPSAGETNVSIEYGKFTSEPVNVIVYKLKPNSVFISSAEISTTGTYTLELKGDFINADTNATVDTNVTIIKNIIWSASNDATIDTNATNNVTTIQIENTEETNVTATVFADANLSATKSYIIN